MKRRGLTVDPKLAVGDGALGFWKALPQVRGETRTQRCQVHHNHRIRTPSIGYRPDDWMLGPKQGCIRLFVDRDIHNTTAKVITIGRHIALPSGQPQSERRTRSRDHAVQSLSHPMASLSVSAIADLEKRSLT